jgi:dipeptidyl-peptidase-4
VNPRLPLALFSITLATAQQFTPADYARAEKFMPYNTSPLIYGTGARPAWLPDGRFTYRTTTPEGAQFIVVDPANATRQPAFDHVKLAAALSSAAGATYDAHHLPFNEIELTDSEVLFNIAAKKYTCDIAGTRCYQSNAARRATNESLSPDKKRAAFIRDYNLWVRDVATGKETQLTRDGVQDFGYATDNAGWAYSDRAVLAWSPDSRKIATYQQDQRGVGEMYLVNTQVGHPELRAWKYPLPGDAVVTTIQRVIIDALDPNTVRLKMPADQHRSTLCDNVACRGGEWSDVQWSADDTRVAFVSTSRDHRHEQLRIADASTGEIRDVLEESVPTFYESGNGRVNWRYLSASNEIIWFSERDNWGQLYLYDINGKLKNQITTGEGNVTQLLRVDETNRRLYFLGVGREKGRDPYFIHFYRTDFDGKRVELLTPEDANHEIATPVRMSLPLRLCATKPAGSFQPSRNRTLQSSSPPAGSRRFP